MSRPTYDTPEWDEVQREYEQLSGAEVPGFHARTVIDDTIGKLYAARCRLVTEIPAAVPVLLDDLEALAEKLVDELYDPNAEPVEHAVATTAELPEPVRRYGGGCLSASGSETLGWCSCGGLFLADSLSTAAQPATQSTEPAE